MVNVKAYAYSVRPAAASLRAAFAVGTHKAHIARDRSELRLAVCRGERRILAGNLSRQAREPAEYLVEVVHRPLHGAHVFAELLGQLHHEQRTFIVVHAHHQGHLVGRRAGELILQRCGEQVVIDNGIPELPDQSATWDGRWAVQDDWARPTLRAETAAGR